MRADFGVGFFDPVELRRDVAIMDPGRDVAEVAPEILLFLAFGDADVGRDADDDFMQGQPPRAKHRQFLGRQAGQCGQFVDLIGGDQSAFRPEDGFQRTELARNPRTYAGIPGRFRLLCVRHAIHQRDPVLHSWT